MKLFAAPVDEAAPRFALYSGHDVGPLGTFLPALGFAVRADEQWPPFASMLTLERWQAPDGEYVRFAFNGQRTAPAVCQGLEWCPADKFVAALRELVPGQRCFGAAAPVGVVV